MKILDATYGNKEMWYQKNHQFVTFMDKRNGYYFYQYPNSPKKEEYHIKPDVVSEWKDAPFSENTFDLIPFDPPHMLKNTEKGIFSAKYTQLNPLTWRQTLSDGIQRLFMVLKPDGIFIFKWCESNILLEEVLKLFPYPPLFGTKARSKRVNSGNICWVVFLKHNINNKLEV
jgi:hypothetical protein